MGDGLIDDSIEGNSLSNSVGIDDLSFVGKDVGYSMGGEIGDKLWPTEFGDSEIILVAFSVGDWDCVLGFVDVAKEDGRLVGPTEIKVSVVGYMAVGIELGASDGIGDGDVDMILKGASDGDNEYSLESGSIVGKTKPVAMGTSLGDGDGDGDVDMILEGTSDGDNGYSLGSNVTLESGSIVGKTKFEAIGTSLGDWELTGTRFGTTEGNPIE